MSENKKMKIEFAPGCFDAFDGTQEELDELIEEIIKMAEDGTLMEQSEPLDIDNLSPEDLEALENSKFLDQISELLDNDYTEAIDKFYDERKRKLN